MPIVNETERSNDMITPTIQNNNADPLQKMPPNYTNYPTQPSSHPYFSPSVEPHCYINDASSASYPTVAAIYGNDEWSGNKNRSSPDYGHQTLSSVIDEGKKLLEEDELSDKLKARIFSY
jgi:hypothetical protein